MKTITQANVAALLSSAAGSPRKRINLNLHEHLSDTTNRFVNAGLSETYARPHRHRAGKWELLAILEGACDVVLFNQDGSVDCHVLMTQGGVSVVEIPGGKWHTLLFHPGVILEVKPGPYEPELDKEFAVWSPREEDTMAAQNYLSRLKASLHKAN